MAEKAYIVEAVRTAGGKRDGRLSLWHPADLGAKVLDELVTRLEDNFSWRPVTPADSIETIMYRAGQASVIEYIKSIMEDEI